MVIKSITGHFLTLCKFAEMFVHLQQSITEHYQFIRSQAKIFLE